MDIIDMNHLQQRCQNMQLIISNNKRSIHLDIFHLLYMSRNAYPWHSESKKMQDYISSCQKSAFQSIVRNVANIIDSISVG